MKTWQETWSAADGWSAADDSPTPAGADLVLVFGSRQALVHPSALAELRERHPGARVMGCSTAGEIRDVSVLDDSIVATGVSFEHTSLRLLSEPIAGPGECAELGRRLARQLVAPDLAHVFVLSDGVHVNGSQLVAGFNELLPSDVALTGGLSGDADRFECTLTIADDAPAADRVVALGLYGSRLRVGFGSQGGWDQFGPARIVTRSSGNVLYELDGEPALEVYRKYLGAHAAELPGSALRFPLSVLGNGDGDPVVRTVLGIDPAANTMTFAGDVPQGSEARLMMANFERLVDGASAAAEAASASLREPADLAILISCVGRKLVLGQRIEEEIESARAMLGSRPVMTGFYSYGEISPLSPFAPCRLQNQTMTITTFREC